MTYEQHLQFRAFVNIPDFLTNKWMCYPFHRRWNETCLGCKLPRIHHPKIVESDGLNKDSFCLIVLFLF